MHHCLGTQDVLSVICDFIWKESDTAQTARRSLVALAVACREFEEVALDTLWNTQTSLVPLIKCMPPDLWKETPPTGFDRSLDFTRPLTYGDLVRFDYYARRIRHLNYLPYAWHRTSITSTVWHSSTPVGSFRGRLNSVLRFHDLECLSTIWEFRHSQPLLPNLRWLQFASAQHATYRPDMFLESGLVSLRLRWSDSDEDIETLFPFMRELSPNLEELDLGSFKNLRSKEGPEFSELICYLKHLRGLACGCRLLSSAAIRHLAALPFLETLQFPNAAGDILEALVEDGSTEFFPSLRRLSVKEWNFTSLAAVVERIRPTHLTSLVVNYNATPSAAETQRFFQSLKNSPSRCTLQDLSLNQIWKSKTHDFFAHTEVHKQDVTFDRSTFFPLYELRNLTTLNLDLTGSFLIGDAHMVEFAEAWPGLRELHLGSLRGWGCVSGITLEGLRILIQGCPELEKLGITLDASQLPPATSRASQQPANMKVTYLQLGNSIIDNPLAVAEFLSQLFPRLRGIGGMWLYDSEFDLSESERNYAKLWTRVSSIMGELRAAK